MMLLVGLVVGMVSGVVGIGGGILFVPALIWLVQHISELWLRRIFALTLIAIGGRMWFSQ
jgi:uncharacterized membrane protein YfcA